MGKPFKNIDILEAVVIGAGMSTVIYSVNDLTTSVGLVIVYILALFVQLTWKEMTQDISYCYDLNLRSSPSSGILLGSLLLPLAIISTQQNSSPSHLAEGDNDSTLAVPCLLFSIACLLCVWLTRCKMSVSVLERLVSVRWVVSWMLVLVVLNRVPLHGVVAIAVSIGGSVTCVWYLVDLLYVLEESFTIGEAIVVAQGLTLLTLEAVNTSVYHTGRELIACLQVLVLGGIIIGLLMKPVLQKMPTIYTTNISRGNHKKSGNGGHHINRIEDIPRPFSWKLTTYFYLAMAACIICILLPWLGMMIEIWPLLFGLRFTLMTSEKRTCLVLIWAGLISTAITMVFCLQISSTVTRKYFHLFTVAAFVPGIYFDVELVFLATAGTFFIAILLEFFRIHQVWPLGEALQSASQILGDVQDTGVIFLSHLYLLLGLAVPVWLYTGVHGYHIDSCLPLFSGVLSLGIGDTAASVIGSQFGHIKWPGNTVCLHCGRNSTEFKKHVLENCSLLDYILKKHVNCDPTGCGYKKEYHTCNLCCQCGVAIAPNPANMCVSCLRTQVDITEGIPKQGTLYFCRACERYLQPPAQWVTCTLESRELLGLCLKKIKGLAKVRLVDAGFVWTEPHSKRIKVKLTIQKEVMGGAILEQVFVVEFTVQNQMCSDCHRVEAKDFWKAVVQLRQKTSHKKTFYYLEQLILKHNVHQNTLNIKQHDEGLDFFYATVDHARKMVDFLRTVTPCKYKTSQQLISHDVHSNTFNYKHTFSVEIVPVCKDDVVCLPKKLACSLGNLGQVCVCTRVTTTVQVMDPNTLQVGEISGPGFWRSPFCTICEGKQLIEYIILQIERLEDKDRRHIKGEGARSQKHMLADAWVMRAQDMGVTDAQYHCRTHLGHILKAGDSVLGFDMSSTNINDDNLAQINPDNLPDVVLVKKHYGDRNRRHRKRNWKLKVLSKDDARMDTDSADGDYIGFLEDLEEDTEYRRNINIYKDKNKVPVEPSDTEEDAPQISLQEMLDDLHLTDDEGALEQQGAAAIQQPMA